jgi:DNA-binding protein H-NS
MSISWQMQHNVTHNRCHATYNDFCAEMVEAAFAPLALQNFCLYFFAAPIYLPRFQAPGHGQVPGSKTEGNAMPRSANLSKLSVDQLINLRSQVDAMLSTKVTQERRSLETQLAALSRVNGAGAKSGPSLGGGTVAPKYRNPENPSETWAGRGLKPRWLTAALKGGKKLEHFSIAASAKTAAVKTSRARARKAKK